jgi:hypothetical protein
MWIGMMRRGSPAETPAAEEPPGSGIILRTEVITIWVPRALREMARQWAGPLVDYPPEHVQIYLARNGWRVGWYALTCRGYQVNGQSGEITHIRWLSEAADHPDELQAVMATAAGRPSRFQGSGFSHARVEIIPETLQAADSREAITRRMAELVVGGVGCSRIDLPDPGTLATQRSRAEAGP